MSIISCIFEQFDLLEKRIPDNSTLGDGIEPQLSSFQSSHSLFTRIDVRLRFEMSQFLDALQTQLLWW